MRGRRDVSGFFLFFFLEFGFALLCFALLVWFGWMRGFGDFSLALREVLVREGWMVDDG